MSITLSLYLYFSDLEFTSEYLPADNFRWTVHLRYSSRVSTLAVLLGVVVNLSLVALLMLLEVVVLLIDSYC